MFDRGQFGMLGKPKLRFCFCQRVLGLRNVKVRSMPLRGEVAHSAFLHGECFQATCLHKRTQP